jgi:pyrroline-5-carboxylate reductase
VVEPNEAEAARLRDKGVATVTGYTELTRDFTPDVVLFAVKPQVMKDVVPDYRRYVWPETVFLSIAAGTPIEAFERMLGAEARIVRAMPNTPSAIGQGMLVACPNALVGDGQRRLCQELLSAVGKVSWIEDEKLMDAVTGVSGSGPAYVFYFIECLTEAGVSQGLSRELASELALQTVAGAGALAARAERDVAELRRDVTSPQGTTAAGLDVLMADGGLAPLLRRTVAAAAERSKELSRSDD